MRILALTGQFRPMVGGAEVQAARLARQWASLGHEVEIWTRRLERDHPREEMEGGAVVHRLGWASGAKFLRVRRLEKIHFCLVLLLRLVSRKSRYDVVIAQQALYPAVIASIAAWLTGRPLAIRIASSGATGEFENWGALVGPAVALFRSQAKALIVLNRESEGDGRARGFLPDRIHRIPNGLAVQPLRTARNGSWPLKVIYVGAFRPEKHVELLLRSWALAALEGELVLVGDGPSRRAMEDLSVKLGISPSFLGQVQAPRELLHEGDIFVLPSDAEGMSNALLEAMAEGCACVATCISGNIDCLAPETEGPPAPGAVIRGSAGWLFSCGDEAALAAALRLLAGDAELRRNLGARARARALAEYSLERTAQQYVKVFERL